MTVLSFTAVSFIYDWSAIINATTHNIHIHKNRGTEIFGRARGHGNYRSVSGNVSGIKTSNDFFSAVTGVKLVRKSSRRCDVVLGFYLEIMRHS
jgi:hypothetical protein